MRTVRTVLNVARRATSLADTEPRREMGKDYRGGASSTNALQVMMH